MSNVKQEVELANRDYVENFGDKGQLQIPPSRQFAVLTCMDARLDPAKFAGFAEGEAHVIRNAGGRASSDAIRSLVLSHKLLGTQEWFVVHHTDCGMEKFDQQTMATLLEESLHTAIADQTGWHNVTQEGGTIEGHFVNWLTINDLKHSVVEDVQRIKASPMVPKDIPIYGYVFDCETGELIEVEEATKAGVAA
ncbi:carbonic anhydrase [Enterovibrio norvegicus]|uniref:Carbonic anhydrase n=2 Tax=Enterovibrio norvegicus TaxID=188144 RepID=A0A1I5T3C1_9GAMM|nr:carbonic anhydrase [Enterovibrio norvegicus]MCC4799078.1 carbonic anhydrase [Enterovibrio norvegicus]OEE43191.1 carbonic anhydrase [Enterovibrio norvegicus]OEF48839.1 carbonic anhydrase [Enterovibrio norvegicus]PMH66276.1 carbonic anhydrase [Enterovibrio norvegicus]PMI25904.1 carbonic anhydrase [Enterovibrio norvegicus]